MIDDGGPAFPFEFHNQTSSHQESFFNDRPPLKPHASEQYGGMSLRDWFAGMALQGILSRSDRPKPDASIRIAFEYADGMIVERKKALL